MLQNLAKCACTRRAGTSLTLTSPLSTGHAPKRFYATGKNEDLIRLLKEREKEEDSSPTRNKYKIRRFRMAAATIEKLDFRVQNGDELMSLRGVGPSTRNLINAFLGIKGFSPPPTEPDGPSREMIVKTLITVPGLGRARAEALYDSGCDSIAKLHLKKYKDTLTNKVLGGLKYMAHMEHPIPRENVETIIDFYKSFAQTDGQEIIIASEYRRDTSTLLGPIEFLIIDKNAADPIPTPPHPSTLKSPHLRQPNRAVQPFKQRYITDHMKAKSVLLNKIIRSLGSMGLVSDMATGGTNLWQGWVRVPKKGESWETRKERLEGIRSMSGDFHQVNITYAPEKSRGAALLALTGDWSFYFHCKWKAVQAGLYLDEWGLWEWEPDPESHSRFQTSVAPHEKTSLGAIWGSETEKDKGRWIQLDSVQEERILENIGLDYVPPKKRNLRFIISK